MDAKTLDRFTAKYVEGSAVECWPWLASVNGEGYGWFRDGKVRNAHRVAYEHFVGPIPAGMDVDHLCRNTGCVNPAHLQPVSRRENILRGIGVTAQNARKTRCKRGHPLSGDNLLLDSRGRACRACRALTH